MKYTLIALSFAFIGCSSAQKTETPAAKPTSAPAANTEAKKAEAAKPKVATEVKPTQTTEGRVTCKFDGITRELAVVNKDDKCVVEYTKDGAMSEVANGYLNSPHCPEVMNRIKDKLAAAGYTCQ